MPNSRRLTLEQLRAFVSVAEALSFTDAAKVQMRTQTAMTRQIKTIEGILGESLLRRSRGHVDGLTEAGFRLLPFARKTLATVDDAWSALSRPTVTGRIRIGIMDDIDVGWLNDLITRFRDSQPNCEVRAISDFSARLEARLQNHEIDIAFIKRLGANDKSVHKRLLRREPLVWAAGPGFRWEPDRPLPIVVFHDGCVYRAHILERLRNLGFTPYIAYEGQSYANVRAATHSGFGITALAESQIIAAGLIQIKSLGEKRLTDLGMVEVTVSYSETRSNPAVRALVREIQNSMT